MPDSTENGADRTTSSSSGCCCGDGVESSEGTDPIGTTSAVSERWVGDSSVLDDPLPTDVQAGLGRLFDRESIDTFRDWVTEVRQRTGGGSIDVEDLCHSGEQTDHRGVMGGETYHFLCFYDAVLLSALATEPVDVRTTSPNGAVIEILAMGSGDLTPDPEGTVMSFGVDETVSPPDDGQPKLGDIYAAVCPFVQAFPNRVAYERWSESVSAATVAMPLVSATAVTAALVE